MRGKQTNSTGKIELREGNKQIIENESMIEIGRSKRKGRR
jgi:hypothetical protein